MTTPNGSIFAYFGSIADPNNCALPSGDTGNLLSSGACDVSQLVGSYSIVDCASLDPTTTVTEVDLVVDSGYVATEPFTFLPTVGLSNPSSMNQCQNGGFASFGYANQGQCIRFVNTGR